MVRFRCSLYAVLVEDLAGCSSGHEVAVIGPAGVVVDEPGVDLGAELPEALEATAVERGTPAFLQRSALESFTYSVVVRGTGRRPVMSDAELSEMGIESGSELGTVVGEYVGYGLKVAGSQLGRHG